MPLGRIRRRREIPRRAVEFRQENSHIRVAGRRFQSRGRARAWQTERRFDEQAHRIRAFGHVSDGKGIDALETVEVHRVEAIDVEFAEVVLRNHCQADLFGLRLWDLELRGVEVQKGRLGVLLLLRLLRLRVLLRRRD